MRFLNAACKWWYLENQSIKIPVITVQTNQLIGPDIIRLETCC